MENTIERGWGFTALTCWNFPGEIYSVTEKKKCGWAILRQLDKFSMVKPKGCINLFEERLRAWSENIPIVPCPQSGPVSQVHCRKRDLFYYALAKRLFLRSLSHSHKAVLAETIRDGLPVVGNMSEHHWGMHAECHMQRYCAILVCTRQGNTLISMGSKREAWNSWEWRGWWGLKQRGLDLSVGRLIDLASTVNWWHPWRK